MKRVMAFLSDEQGAELREMAQEHRRSVKSMAEVIIIDAINRRGDGLTDAEYVELNRVTRSNR